MLEIKSGVVPFQRHLTLTPCLLADQGLLIRELTLGRVNHDRMRKWVRTMYVPESTCHRETFLPQRKIPFKAGF
jgi:hypothetical protein